MKSFDLNIRNLEETRKKSLTLWREIPSELFFWRPGINAMSFIETVRFVLEKEYKAHHTILNGSELFSIDSPWEGIAFTTINDEIEFAQNFRIQFIATLSYLSTQNMNMLTIETAGRKVELEKYLIELGTEESIYTDQLAFRLRAIGLNISHYYPYSLKQSA